MKWYKNKMIQKIKWYKNKMIQKNKNLKKWNKKYINIKYI